MELVAYSDPDEFGAAIDPLAARHPVVMNHMRTSLWTGVPVQAWVGGEAEVAALVLGDNTFLSPLTPAAFEPIAEVVAPNGGVLRGAPGDVSAVAGRWSDIHGGAYEPGMTLRIYELADVLIPSVEGFARPAAEHEFEEIFTWACGMTEDVGEPRDAEEYRPNVWRRFELGQFWCWEVDGQRVAQLFCSRVAHRSVRIGGVYTPPRLRGNGFAAALTAHVSAGLAADGLIVTLNTQTGNALTNRLYRRIGFVGVGDLMAMRLRR